MYGGDNSDRPLGPDPVNNGTGTFGAENDYDQPAAIVSGGDDGGAVAFDSSKNDNSAKLFGHRSRDRAVKSSAAAQPQVDMNLVAASNIASNPNNPEFFRQAAAQSATEQIKRQPRQINKKPFIIGGIAILAIALIALAVAFAPKLFQNINDKKIADIQINATDYLDDISYYDEIIKMSKENVIELRGLITYNESEYNKTVEALDTHLNRSKELQKKLNDAKKSGTNDEAFDELVSEASKALDKRVTIYETYGTALKGITEALYANNTKSAKEILGNYSGTDIAKVAERIDNYWSRIRNLENQQSNNNCGSGSTTAVCENIQESIDEANRQFSNDKSVNAALLSLISDKDYENDRIIIQLRQISEYNNEAKDEKEDK